MPSGQLQSRFGYALFGSYLIIPYFDKKNIFHYFTVSNAQNASFNSLPPYFIYDITVDMRLDGGLGDVAEGLQPQYQWQSAALARDARPYLPIAQTPARLAQARGNRAEE